jgi:hypothetical protein
MKKTVLAIATAATIGVTALVTPSPAQAWRGGWGPGLAGGLIAGAVIGGIVTVGDGQVAIPACVVRIVPGFVGFVDPLGVGSAIHLELSGVCAN